MRRFCQRLGPVCCIGLCLLQPVWAGEEVFPDPMRPADYLDPAATQTFAVTTTDESASLVLSATYLVNGIRKAVINGQSLREGESVAGAVLVKIDSGEVLMRRDEEKLVLKLIARANNEKAFFRKETAHEH